MDRTTERNVVQIAAKEPWHVQRRRELAAAAPVKRKKVEPFVKVPLWFAVAATKATRTPKALVWLELLHASWKAQSLTFPLPNKRLAEGGVSRWTKYRALRELEAAGLITVEWRQRKTPIITLVVL